MDDASNHVDAEPERGDESAVAVEVYETDDGVVFYDAENPLAWIQTDATVGLEEAA